VLSMNRLERTIAYVVGPVRYGSAVALALLVLVSGLLVTSTQMAVITALIVLAMCLLFAYYHSRKDPPPQHQ